MGYGFALDGVKSLLLLMLFGYFPAFMHGGQFDPYGLYLKVY
jgi:hypothetical protein